MTDVVGVAAVVGIQSVAVRIQMKMRDQEIKKQAEKERNTEQEEENRAPEVGVMHHKHLEHLLDEVNADDEFICGGCERAGRGRRFRCRDDSCSFEMHRGCVSSPVMLVGDDSAAQEELPETVKTFAHEKHDVHKVHKKVEIFECGHCNNVSRGFRYACKVRSCKCILHPICATSSSRINSFMHPEHELQLLTRPYLAKCAVCNRGRKSYINNRIYTCKPCKWYVHPTCTLWPQYLFHELHPKTHPLQLKVSSSSSSTCGACKDKCDGFGMYRCESCNESFHALLRFSTNVKDDGKPDDAFRKKVVEESEFHVEFAGIDHIGLIG